MTRKTVRITRLDDGRISYFEIGPGESPREARVPMHDLEARLQGSGVPPEQLEELMNALPKTGTGYASFVPVSHRERREAAAMVRGSTRGKSGRHSTR